MSSKKSQKKELPIYDPEGVDPQTNLSYEEVKVPLQEHITATRRAIQRSWTSVKEACAKLSGDTHSNLTNMTGKARRHTNSTLVSMGVEDSGQLLRGSAYAGAAIVGLYLARRRSMFLRIVYPLVGVGLVGGALHRDQVYTNYQKIIGGHRGNLTLWKKQQEKVTTDSNLEKNIRSQLRDRNSSGKKVD